MPLSYFPNVSGRDEQWHLYEVESYQIELFVEQLNCPLQTRYTTLDSQRLIGRHKSRQTPANSTKFIQHASADSHCHRRGGAGIH